MIKRKYFYNIKWLHQDGKQSYSYKYGVVTHASVFRDAWYVFNLITKQFEEEMEARFPDGSIEVISFNRI